MRIASFAGLMTVLVLCHTAAAETAQQQAEKQARRACEAKICDVVATRDPIGEEIACDIVQTWSEEDIVELIGVDIDWPWGSAMCRSKIALERSAVAKAMSEPAYEMTMPAQTARCEVSQNQNGEPYVIEISLAPKVKFETGKAVAARLNWGKASAPMTIYPLIYAATALDNSANVLGRELVRLVNEFIAKKCVAVKAELPLREPTRRRPPGLEQ